MVFILEKGFSSSFFSNQASALRITTVMDNIIVFNKKIYWALFCTTIELVLSFPHGIFPCTHAPSDMLSNVPEGHLEETPGDNLDS